MADIKEKLGAVTMAIKRTIRDWMVQREIDGYWALLDAADSLSVLDFVISVYDIFGAKDPTTGDFLLMEVMQKAESPFFAEDTKKGLRDIEQQFELILCKSDDKELVPLFEKICSKLLPSDICDLINLTGDILLIMDVYELSKTVARENDRK